MLQSETNDQTHNNHASQGIVNHLDPNATVRGSIDTQGRVQDEENIDISSPEVNHDIKFKGMELQGITSI